MNTTLSMKPGILKAIAKCAGKESGRMDYVLFERIKGESHVSIVATNGHCMVIHKVPVMSEDSPVDPSFSVVVPASLLLAEKKTKHLPTWLTLADRVTLRGGGVETTADYVDEKFPDYRQVLPAHDAKPGAFLSVGLNVDYLRMLQDVIDAAESGCPGYPDIAVVRFFENAPRRAKDDETGDADGRITDTDYPRKVITMGDGDTMGYLMPCRLTAGRD